MRGEYNQWPIRVCVLEQVPILIRVLWPRLELDLDTKLLLKHMPEFGIRSYVPAKIVTCGASGWYHLHGCCFKLLRLILHYTYKRKSIKTFQLEK